MDVVFRALASPVRRRILDILKERPGSSVNTVSEFFEISRIAVMKHLQILEESNLIHSEKEGRTRKLYFNAVPIQMIYDRWTDDYSAFWSGRMADIKTRVEARAESKDNRSA